MWLLLSLSATLLNSFENVLQKKAASASNIFAMMWVILATPTIFYLPILLHVGWPTHLGALFWPAVLARVVIASASVVCLFQALRLSQLSLVVPIQALKPVLILFISLLINHLFPSPLGVIGVLIVVAGVYVLNFDRVSHQWLSPFRNIWHDRGLHFILANCVLASIATPLLRLGIDNSNAVFYAAFFQPFWALCFTPVAILAGPAAFKSLFRHRSTTTLIAIGTMDGVQNFMQNIAYSLTLPVYVSAVQGTNLLFSSVFGLYFFGEKIKARLIPTLIIIAGIVLIALS